MDDQLKLSDALHGKRIKIFTRSFSLELYRQAAALFENVVNIPTVRLTDQTADGYFYTMLQDLECDIAINIDEDAFVVNPQAMLDLAEFVVIHGYANAGCPDGGGGCPRAGNPLVTNPFFNVFNLELIRTKFTSKKDIQSFHYESVKQEMKAKFPMEMLQSTYNFELLDYEPYYPFFFWLAYNFKTYYLPSQKHQDGISTILYNHQNQPICYHAWMARFYSMSSFVVRFIQKGAGKQKLRIDNLIRESYAVRGVQVLSFSVGDRLMFRFDKLVRWCIKVPQRVMGWPRKWAKWYRRWERKRQGAI